MFIPQLYNVADIFPKEEIKPSCSILALFRQANPLTASENLLTTPPFNWINFSRSCSEEVVGTYTQRQCFKFLSVSLPFLPPSSLCSWSARYLPGPERQWRVGSVPMNRFRFLLGRGWRLRKSRSWIKYSVYSVLTLFLFQICGFWSSEHDSKSRGDFVSALWSSEYSDPGTTRDEDLSVRASQKHPSEDLISLSKEAAMWSFIKAKFHVVR